RYKKYVCGHAGLSINIASRCHSAQAGRESQRLIGDRQRIPPQLAKRQSMPGGVRRSLPKRNIGADKATRMFDRRAYAVEPGSGINAMRRGKGRSRQLLGVKTIGAALWRVLPLRERARQRFGLKIVPKAGHVQMCHAR